MDRAPARVHEPHRLVPPRRRTTTTPRRGSGSRRPPAGWGSRGASSSRFGTGGGPHARRSTASSSPASSSPRSWAASPTSACGRKASRRCAASPARARAARPSTRCASPRRCWPSTRRGSGRCPYPSLGLVVAEGQTPGGHSPPGLVYLQVRPPVLRGRVAARRPRELQRPARLLPRPRARPPVVGPGDGPRQLPRAVAVRGVGPVRGRALGARSGSARAPSAACWTASRAGPSGTTRPAPSTSATGSGTCGRTPRSSAPSSTTRAPGLLHMLRGLVGDDAFFRGARAFLERFRFAKAGTDDLREALEAASGRDLRPYFERWIYDTGLPGRSPGRRAPRGPDRDSGRRSTPARRTCPGPCRCRSRSRPPADGRRAP